MESHQIKKLLGSIIYGVRLEILETFEKLQDIFARVEFYERRDKLREVIVDNFETLIENITEFWDKDAKMSIYPQRMAAWLSGYLGELGYPAYDQDYIFRAITHKLGEEEELAKLAKLIELKDPDVKPRIRKVDLELPATDRDAFLGKAIDKFLEEAPKKTKSSIVYMDQAGKLSTLMSEQDITASEAKKTELLTATKFENPLDMPLTDVQINNVIPYHYKVLGITTIGFEGIEPTKKLLDDGLQLTWVIPEIKPKQETKIEVNLERRISRTILMNIEKNTNVINTYFNIEPYKDRFSAANSFRNVQPDIIDHLVIEDEIPTTFNLLEVRPPDEDYLLNMEQEHFEQLLKWQYKEVATEKEIRHIYYLVDKKIFLLTQIIVKSRADNMPVLEINRVIEPNIRYYELVVSYYLKFHKPVTELYIKENISKSVNVTFQSPQSIEKSIEIVENRINQVWKIMPDVASKRFEFGYICSGENIKTEFPIELNIPQFAVSTSNILSMELQKQPVLLPEMHQFLESYKKTATAPKA